MSEQDNLHLTWFKLISETFLGRGKWKRPTGCKVTILMLKLRYVIANFSIALDVLFRIQSSIKYQLFYRILRNRVRFSNDDKTTDQSRLSSLWDSIRSK
jgi:hypothetical protein